MKPSFIRFGVQQCLGLQELQMYHHLLPLPLPRAQQNCTASSEAVRFCSSFKSANCASRSSSSSSSFSPSARVASNCASSASVSLLSFPLPFHHPNLSIHLIIPPPRLLLSTHYLLSLQLPKDHLILRIHNVLGHPNIYIYEIL